MKGQLKFDLEERTAKFGEDIIKLCQKLPKDDITKPLVSQIIRSATSIGANYMEANGASSKKTSAIKYIPAKRGSRNTALAKYDQRCSTSLHPRATSPMARKS